MKKQITFRDDVWAAVVALMKEQLYGKNQISEFINNLVRHEWKRRKEKEYGDDTELLKIKAALARIEKKERRAKNNC